MPPARTTRSTSTHQPLARGGEISEHAFTQLFNLYRLPLYHSALKFVKNQSLAEEVVQEVFLKVWCNRVQIAKADHFGNYIFMMARNLAMDYLKKKLREEEARSEYGRDLFHENSTERHIHSQEYEELFSKAVEVLPPHQREIFHLARVDGLSHEAIAGKMKLSRPSVKAHMKRAMKAIRVRLRV